MPWLEGVLLAQPSSLDGTLFLAPLHPPPADAHAAAYGTERLAAAAGGCLEPSTSLASQQAAPAGDVLEAVSALASLRVVSGPGDVVALSVFHAQTTVSDSVAVASDIAARSHVVSATRDRRTDPMGRWRRCALEFVAQNYLNAMDHLPVTPRPGVATPLSTYMLPVTVWLPPTGIDNRPYPVVMVGHGLGSGRGDGGVLADLAGSLGYATIAIDAWDHGDPSGKPMPNAPERTMVLNVLAASTGGASNVDARALRDHVHGSTHDKLELVRFLQGGIDVDGDDDATPELDPSRRAHVGASLGGVMEPELLALTDACGAAVLVVPGGRGSAIMSDGATFPPVVAMFRPPRATPADVSRVFPALRAVIDRGDAASCGEHVLRDRLEPGGSTRITSALLGIVLDDATVPTKSNYTLSRARVVAVGLPLLRAVPGVAATTYGPPISGNVGAGTAPAGMRSAT